MPGLELLSTADEAPHRRLDYWNAFHDKAVVPTFTDTADLAGFGPSLARTFVSDLWIGRVNSSRAVVHHTREHIAKMCDPLFLLKIQTQGNIQLALAPQSLHEVGQHTVEILSVAHSERDQPLRPRELTSQQGVRHTNHQHLIRLVKSHVIGTRGID